MSKSPEARQVLLGMFFTPLMVAGLGLCMGLSLRWTIPFLLETNPIMVVLAQMSREASAPACLFLLTGASLQAALRSRIWLRWRRGHGPVCCYCGGPAAIRNVGYGVYRTCFACGAMTPA